MKTILFLLVIVVSSSCFAVGWVELTEQNLGEYGVEINLELDNQSNCSKVIAKFPREVFFQDIGTRNLQRLTYKNFKQSIKNTEVQIATTTVDKFEKVNFLCVSHDDFESSVISGFYIGEKSQPPVILDFKLAQLIKTH